MGKRRDDGPAALAKCPTGIRGLDEIMQGGLPRGRPTLVCGGPGCGKTLLGMEFIVRGIRDFGEPGAFMAFEETSQELAANVASLGYDVNDLIRRRKMAVDYVYLERSEIEETGEYDLEGLFIRLNLMIEQVKAKRVVLDSLEALFAGLPNEGILRAELRRLFRWLKDKGVTAVITAEQGKGTLTRHGLEEYVSDCVIFLDNRVIKQVATRRLRIVKYRGSSHGTNEYPTMIDEHGLSVLPISSLGLNHPVSAERVSSGNARLDEMLDGKGYYKGSSVLVSGTAGTGKTSLAATLAQDTCRRGGRCLYFAFEESPDQIVRNMASVGIDLARHLRKGSLEFQAVRATFHGLEQHLVTMHKKVTMFKPDVVIVDPVTNLRSVGDEEDVKSMLTRMIDFLKNRRITALFTSLTSASSAMEETDVGISSLMDTWLLLRMVESQQERNRVLYVLKSRGMAHSNQMREFRLSRRGIDLLDVYVGQGEVFTGTARVQQESRDRAEALVREQAGRQRRRELEQEREAVTSQIAAMQARLAGLEAQVKLESLGQEAQRRASEEERQRVAKLRKGSSPVA